MNKLSLGIIILAAGEASRMGQAKQLLTLQDKTLLEICVQKASDLQPASITIVLGAHFNKTQAEAQRLQQRYSGQPINWVENPQWATGMGSSIRAGVQKTLQVLPQATQILILLADQPLIQTSQLQALLEVSQTCHLAIIASKYGESFGVPAVFDQSLFEELLQLNEKAGAKKVMKKHQTQMRLVALPEAAFDMDTPEEYEVIKQKVEGERK
ncbi:MAG TPA: 4-diphosphocytidyl-2C-methyl-D-erythritol synthase [Microscillaceae bacterium]|nr:4-diphosphocytidyl-2C-methyl-D-erythritol synthase [Microscillaceae bacterium]